MSGVTVKMKMSPAKAGALYMRTIKLEDQISGLNKKLAEVREIANGDFDDEMEMGDALYNIKCLLNGE